MESEAKETVSHNTEDNGSSTNEEQVTSCNLNDNSIIQRNEVATVSLSTTVDQRPEDKASIMSSIRQNRSLNLSTNISRISVMPYNNFCSTVPVTCQSIPSPSCYITSSRLLHLPSASIKLPTLFQLCVTQLNESSISISGFKNIQPVSHQLETRSNDMTFKISNIEAKSTGLSTPSSLTSAPPSYSFVLRQIDMRRRPRLMGTFIPSPSFIVKTPPPTYATAFDIYVDNTIPPPPRIYNYGFTSMPIVCPECGYSGMSLITSRVTICTHLCAVALCVFCCWLCAPLPYVLRSCKNVYHYCRNCRTFLGMYCPTNPENVY